MVSVTGSTGIDGKDAYLWTSRVLQSDGTFKDVPQASGQDGRGGGTAAASANANNTSPTAKVYRSNAFGGDGGNGGAGGDAGVNGALAPSPGGAGALGGNAFANSTSTATQAALATAVGGQGGSSGLPGHLASGALGPKGASGGHGGSAAAVSSDFNNIIPFKGVGYARAMSTATGGKGGVGYGAGSSGGAGGLVGGTASPTTAAAGSARRGEAATAKVTQTGGAGGAGLDGATGGSGADSLLSNAVSGSTNGGALTLVQTAVGGDGGSSDTSFGGRGGNAASSLTFNDTLSPTASRMVTASVMARGGASGAGKVAGFAGSAGAALSVTGATLVNASATAVGGVGYLFAGLAGASTTATGTGGTYSASASTSLHPGQLVRSVSATAGGNVDGKSTAGAAAAIGVPVPGMVTTGQAIAGIDGAPLAADTTAVLNANSAIKTAFGATPDFFGIGELGGGYSVGGTQAQTVTSSFSETVDLTKLKVLQHLVVGFYGGTTVGSGVTGVTFDLYENGVDVVHQSFASASDAQAYFTNNGVDLGQLSGTSLSLTATLTVTSTSANSGFYGNVIVGDPPAAHATSSTSVFAQAMASMGGPKASLVAGGAGSANPYASLIAAPAQ